MKHAGGRPTAEKVTMCKFRKTGVECDDNVCEWCGWNPAVEEKRIRKLCRKEKNHA